MPTLRVDSSLIPAMKAPITVDALLSAVEPVLGESGRRVTALRINGVDEPSFREPDILARTLIGEDDVELDSTPVSVMARDALDDALRFLPELSEEARAVAQFADAVVVGSALVQVIAAHGRSPELLGEVQTFARALKAAVTSS